MPESPGLAPLHPVNRRHLNTLSGDPGDELGVASGTPGPVDHIARALKVDLLHAETLSWASVADSARRNLQLLEDTFDAASGRFVDGGGDPNASTGRALIALGEAIAAAPDPAFVEQAAGLFSHALKAAGRVTSPEAQALVVIGCAAIAAAAEPTVLQRDALALMRNHATRLHVRFLDRARPGWPWPEEVVGSESALLPRALILAGHRSRAETMVGIGLQVLDWLLDVQTAPEGHVSLIGNGRWAFGEARPRFDQRAIDAAALLLAAEAAYQATGDPRYSTAMERCYAWFLGSNDVRVRVANPARGASAGGITATGLRREGGADATLAWLIAAERIRALRDAAPRVMVPLQPGRLARPLQPAITRGAGGAEGAGGARRGETVPDDGARRGPSPRL